MNIGERDLRQLLTVLCFGIAVMNSAAHAQQGPKWGAGPEWSARTNGSNVLQRGNSGGSLPETRALMNNDNLAPTMNRTSAMRLEGENDRLPSGVEQPVKTYLHQNQPPHKTSKIVYAPRGARHHAVQPAHPQTRTWK